jgi:hypothetical protein
MYLINQRRRVWVDKTEEKGSEVNLASHLLRDAFSKKFEVAVLITNDSDLAEPVRIVAHELGLPVGILNPHQFHSRELRQYATFLKRIRPGDLVACQFPRTITDGRVLSPSPRLIGRQDIANPRCRLRHLLFCNRYKTATVTKKKANRFGLTFSYFIDLLDWCGGGDLNPYALRR